MKRTNLLLIVFVACAAALLITGCRSSTITVLGGSKLTSIPLEGNPFELDGDPSAIKLNDNEFAVARMVSPTELRVEKYNRAPVLVWSTPVEIPTPNISFKFTLFAFGTTATSAEVPIKLYRRGNDIVMISYLYGDGDSIFAVGRRFDLATGILRQMKKLDTIIDQSQVDKPYRRYFASMAPDTSRLVLYSYGSGKGRNDFFMRIASVSTDLSSVTARSEPVADYKNVNALVTMRIDTEGDIYLISAHKPDTVRVTKYDINSGTMSRPAVAILPDMDELSAEMSTMASMFNDRYLMLMMGIKDGSDLLGSMNMKFDTREDTFAPTKKCLLTEEKLEQLIDDDDYDDCYLHTAIRTSDPKATNILIYERVTTSTTKRSVLYQTEEVLVMAFDANGEATWQQALRKASPSLDVPPALMTVSASITDNRNLRLLYRNGSEIAVEEFKLADGSPVAGSHKVLMEMGAAAFHLGDFTTWLDDETMIILTRQGVFSKDWSLARFDIK